MAHSTRSHQLTKSRPSAPVPRAESRYEGIDVVTEKLWHFLTSMRFALALMLVLAGLALIGALIQQMPAGVAASPEARSEWLAKVRPRYGGWTGLFDQLQLFTVFTSIWFRAAVVALTLSLLACSIHRVPGILRTATRPHVDVGATFFEHAPQHEIIHATQPGPALLEAARSVMRRHRYRFITHDDGIVHFYSDRNRWAPLTSMAGHLSLVVILAGAVVGSAFGFRDGQFMIAEGSTMPVPSSAGLSVRLDDFRDSYYVDTGGPSDYASDLVVFQDGAEVARQTVRVNEPLRYENVTFYQSFYGTAAIMRVSDASGRELHAEGVPLAWNADDGARKMGTFVLPDQDLTVWVVGTSGPSDPIIKPGEMRLEIYRSSGDGQPVA
ncbi:MAG: cytochrome c biogenesis protein ResB, partial [Chloroflexota bacterium]